MIVVAIVMLVGKQFENYVRQPTSIGRAADVSGFTVIVSVLVFGSLFGVVGAIVAYRSRPPSRSSSTRPPPQARASPPMTPPEPGVLRGTLCGGSKAATGINTGINLSASEGNSDQLIRL